MFDVNHVHDWLSATKEDIELRAALVDLHAALYAGDVFKELDAWEKIFELLLLERGGWSDQ
jgi:hypothetical protein